MQKKHLKIWRHPCLRPQPCACLDPTCHLPSLWTKKLDLWHLSCVSLLKVNCNRLLISLDPVTTVLRHCLRAVAAAEKAVLASLDIVGYSFLTSYMLRQHHICLHRGGLDIITHYLNYLTLRSNAVMSWIQQLFFLQQMMGNQMTVLRSYSEYVPHDQIWQIRPSLTQS